MRPLGGLSQNEIQAFRRDLDPVLKDHGRTVSVMRAHGVRVVQTEKIANDAAPNIEGRLDQRNDVEASKRNVIESRPDPDMMGTRPMNSHLTRYLENDHKMATDPAVSERQEHAMRAAAAGNSTLGIPKEVGKEFTGDQEEGEAMPLSPEIMNYIKQCVTEALGDFLLSMKREDGTDELPEKANPTGTVPNGPVSTNGPHLNARPAPGKPYNPTGAAVGTSGVPTGDEPPPFPGRPEVGHGPKEAHDAQPQPLTVQEAAALKAENAKVARKAVLSVQHKLAPGTVGDSASIQIESERINGKPNKSMVEWEAGLHDKSNRALYGLDSSTISNATAISSAMRVAMSKIGRV
jgi:hypothetical protein